MASAPYPAETRAKGWRFELHRRLQGLRRTDADHHARVPGRGHRCGARAAGDADVTLVLKPRGRGNWRSMTMVLEGERGGLFIRAGQFLFLGGVTWRIAKVIA